MLSSEIDQTKIRFIRKAFIKERGAEVFRKIRMSPILQEPIKDSTPPRTVAGNSEMNCQRGNEIHYALGYRRHLCRLFRRLN
jgi:hypothetical protein